MAPTVAALVCAFIIVGCGGGDSAGEPGNTARAQQTNSVPVSTITKAEFIKRSNAFCDNILNEIRERFAAYKREQQGSGKSQRQLFSRASGDIFLPSLLFWYDDINSLDRPTGDDSQIERMLRTLQSTVVTGLNHPYSYYSAAQLEALYNRSNHLMRRYGITSCVVSKMSFTS